MWSAASQGQVQEKLVCRYKGKQNKDTGGEENEDQLREQVNDICWSPDNSTCFASVANDGRVEIWDLALNNLSPLVCHFDEDSEGNKTGCPKTAVKFARGIPVLFTGDTQGKVHVYRTMGLEHE